MANNQRNDAQSTRQMGECFLDDADDGESTHIPFRINQADSSPSCVLHRLWPTGALICSKHKKQTCLH